MRKGETDNIPISRSGSSPLTPGPPLPSERISDLRLSSLGLGVYDVQSVGCQFADARVGIFKQGTQRRNGGPRLYMKFPESLYGSDSDANSVVLEPFYECWDNKLRLGECATQRPRRLNRNQVIRILKAPHQRRHCRTNPISE